ncbi:MAG: alpha/beta fold hydrolase [Gammaproteobacteria bacterium]
MSTLHVSKYGRAGNGPELVLLHGWGSSSKIWQPCIARLAEELHVWCVDLPGHGKSHDIIWDRSVGQGLTLLANALPQRCVLIGWSLGGLLAQLYVNQYPERVQSLMLIGSTPKFVSAKDWLHAMQISTFQQFVKQYDASPQETLKKFIALQVLHGKSLKPIMLNLEQASIGQQADLNLCNIRWGLDWLLKIDLRETFASLGLPVILFHGVNDQVSPICAAEQAADLCKLAQLFKVTRAGHVPFLSHSEQFIDQVKLMYAKLSSPSTGSIERV